jgi:hypothetical protein
MFQKSRHFLVVVLTLACSLSASVGAAQQADEPIRVFILAGQSNMEGQGVVDLDHPQYYNGGRGTLLHILRDPEKSKDYQHIRDKDGKWVVRDDVWCRFRTKREIKRGSLTIGFAGYPGTATIGSETPKATF